MRAQRFDLGAGQREAGLERFLDKEVVARLAIIDDQLEAVGSVFAVRVLDRAANTQSLSAGRSDKWVSGDANSTRLETLHWRSGNRSHRP